MIWHNELKIKFILNFKVGDVSMVQALIVFGADVNQLNNLNESPRHIAANSRNKNRQGPTLYYTKLVQAQVL